MSNSEVEFNEQDAIESSPPLDGSIVVEENSVEAQLPVEDTQPVAESEVSVPNARLTSEVDSDKVGGTYLGALPSKVLSEFTAALLRFSEVIKEPTPEMKHWRDVSTEASEFYLPGSLYEDRFKDPSSSFEQGVMDQGGNLLSTAPLKFKNATGELKGELALLKVSKLLGMGDVVNVCLPHSGIWVTIKPPTEKDLIDFYNTVFREKVMLGRSTSGLTFSNFSVYMNSKLFDFIIRHVHSVNYGDLPKDELKNYIVIHDFAILAWGFACAIYPNGFDFQRACVTELEECSYIARDTINLTKLVWVDNAALSPAQKVILSENRPNKLALESYRKFSADHTRVVGSTHVTKNGIKLKFKIPTFAEYTTDGLAWINGISNTVETVMVSTEDNEEGKIELLSQYVKASILRQFNHFVDFIEFEDGVVTDRATINNLLEMFSGDDALRGEITEAIVKFKNNTTIGIIGIPEYTCPACKTKQSGNHELPRLVNVIPLDSVNLFFLMLTSRISKILEREV